MSLQTRFAILFAVVGLAAVFSVVIAFASFELMSSEVREPFRRMSSVLTELGQIKQRVEELSRTVDARPRTQTPGTAVATGNSPSAPNLAVTLTALTDLDRRLTRLRETDYAPTLIGVSTFANLESRANAAERPLLMGLLAQQTPQLPHSVASPWNATMQHTSRALASRELHELHNLIERIERQIVEGTDTTIKYALDMRTRLLTLLGLAVGVAALTAFLGLILIRRWVLRPVERLRIATAHVASGNFDYRIEAPASPSRDELASLARDVNHMSAMVKSMQDERVDRERLAALGEMLRRLAHNLRNPLSGIRGLAELSKADLANTAPLSPADRTELVDHQHRIITAVDRFEQWLADLLRATKPAQLNLSSCDCRPWLETITETYRPSAEAKGIQLVLDASAAPPSALCDPSHLEHAVGALIANAIEAASTSPATPRMVNVRSFSVPSPNHAQEQSENPHWAIEITDSGPGVPVELRDRIFAPYFTTKRDGSGIGLASALQVVRAHGGTLILDPAPPAAVSASGTPQRLTGAVFRMTIPTSPSLAKDDQVARIGQ